MFQKGDYVVYGNLGVCRVEGLEERRFEGLETAHPYYQLSPFTRAGCCMSRRTTPGSPCGR